jgi:enoyl-CoA hydratase/carnithine racemase
MNFLSITHHDSIAVVTFSRGKVNAINGEVVAEFDSLLDQLESDSKTEGVVLTGQGAFFSFGFDVPELYDYTPDDFTKFLESFCALSKKLFLFPKPVVAAVNGHAVAGGCILALSCDCRIMAEGKAKMALNEVTFGSSLFASAVEMLRHTVGGPNAEEIVLTGQMYDAASSRRMNLVNGIVPPDDLLPVAIDVAEKLAENSGPAFAGLKRLIRGPIADGWMNREAESIREFVTIWYSPETREKTKQIQIR